MTLIAKSPLLIHVEEIEPSVWFSISFCGGIILAIWYDLILHMPQRSERIAVKKLNKNLPIFDAVFLPQILQGEWLIFLFSMQF